MIDEKTHGRGHLKISQKKVSEKCTELGMVYQRFNLFPHMTALQKVAEAPIAVKKQLVWEAMDYTHELLKKVGLNGEKFSFIQKVTTKSPNE
jgi:polar amino acid transport system ATP-binding protein